MTYRRVLKFEDDQTWITIKWTTQHKLDNYMKKNDIVFFDKAINKLLRGNNKLNKLGVVNK